MDTITDEATQRVHNKNNFFAQTFCITFTKKYKNLFISTSLDIYLELLLVNITKTFIYSHDRAVTYMRSMHFPKLFLFIFDSFVFVQVDDKIINFRGCMHNLLIHLIVCIYYLIKLVVTFLYLHRIINFDNTEGLEILLLHKTLSIKVELISIWYSTSQKVCIQLTYISFKTYINILNVHHFKT
jgi:hypothetical protein